MVNDGYLPIRESLLGTWNTEGVAADHYTLTLVVELQNGLRITESDYFLVDPGFHKGWPVTLDGDYVDEHCTVEDVNADGLLEVLIAQGNKVYVKTHDGHNLHGWPQEANQGSLFASSPLVADLTGDSQPEIIAFASKLEKLDDPNIYVWHVDGTPVPGWPKSRYLTWKGTVADIDGDNWNEIICITRGASLLVLNHNGDLIWQIDLPDVSYASPIVADVDGDGYKEIGVASYSPEGYYLCIYRYNGKCMWGWPRYVPITPYRVQPTFGDLNGDGFLELVVSVGKAVYAFNYQGEHFDGWPQKWIMELLNPVTLADVNGDGCLEVIAGTIWRIENKGRDSASYLYVWDGYGRILPNWPLRHVVNRRQAFDAIGFASPAAVDIDGDNRHDIVVSTSTTLPYRPLHAYRYDATEIHDFPKRTIGVSKPGPTSAL